jgi:hypothetical protein
MNIKFDEIFNIDKNINLDSIPLKKNDINININNI